MIDRLNIAQGVQVQPPTSARSGSGNLAIPKVGRDSSSDGSSIGSHLSSVRGTPSRKGSSMHMDKLRAQAT